MAGNGVQMITAVLFDLDETLIYAVESPLPDRTADFRAGRWHVYKRPHVDTFLEGCRARFARIAVWTSASPSYATAIVANLFSERGEWLDFVWSGERCTERRQRSPRDRLELLDRLHPPTLPEVTGR